MDRSLDEVGRLEDEERIVWLRDRKALAGMKWVLFSLRPFPLRTGPVRACAGEVLIGYAVLKKSVARSKDGVFWRRVFTRSLKEVPQGETPDDILDEIQDEIPDEVPEGAVDPMTVFPGVAGRSIRPKG